MSLIRIIPMSRVKSANKDNAGHWFNGRETRFFNSRYPRTATLFKNVAYFVSSEQYDSDSERLYTTRACDMLTGKVTTVGEFQQYKTGSLANDALNTMLGV